MNMALVKKTILRIAGTLLLFAVLLGAATSSALVWISGERGREFIAARAEALVSDEYLSLDIGKITVMSSRELRVRQLILSDRDGVFLTLDDLRAEFDLKSILRGSFLFNRLGAGKVLLGRLPQSPAPAKNAAMTGTVYSGLPRLRVDEFHATEIILAESISGSREKFSLRGRLALSPELRENYVSFTIDAPGLTTDLVQLHFSPIQDRDGMLLRAHARDDGSGILARLAGVPSLSVFIEGSGPPGEWHGELKGKVGENFSITSSLIARLEKDSLAVISDGLIKAGGSSATGKTSVTYPFGGQEINAGFEGNIRAGDAEVTDLHLAAALNPAKEWPLRAEGSWAGVSLGQEVRELDNSQFTLSAEMNGNVIEIESARLENRLASLDASGNVDIAGGLDLTVKARVQELANLIPELGGSAAAEIKLTGTLTPLSVTAGITAAAENFVTPYPHVETYLGTAPQAVSRIRMDDRGISVEDGELRGGKTEPLHFSGRVGNAAGPLPAEFNIAGAWDGYEITGDISFDNNVVSVSGLNVSKGDLSVASSGSYHIETSTINAETHAVINSLAVMNAELSGTPEHVDFSGSLESEQDVPFNFDFAGNFSGADGMLLELNRLEGHVAENNIRMISPVTLLSGETVSLENAAFEFGGGNISLSLSPFRPEKSAAIKGNARASLNIAELAELAGADGHRLDGSIVVDVDVGGTASQPLVSGSGSLKNGEYENLLTGTVLQDINAGIAMAEGRLLISALSGSSPGGGSFGGQGEIDFSSGYSAPQLSAGLNLDNLQLADNDMMGLAVSGSVNASVSPEAAEIKGDLEIDRAEYYVSGLGGGASYSGFTIVEKDGEKLLNGGPAQDRYKVALDISLKADHGIFVRGPQIETEWAADLSIGGLVDAPEVRGNISVVRGDLQVLDTRVELEEGNVAFVNRDPANPELDIKGTFRGDEMDATINITGPASAPELSFSSEPPMPQDEILSHALFGTGVAELSPVQALKLAGMVASLSGGSGQGGFDPLGELRRAIGLDSVSVGYDEGGPTLSVGKYVGDNVYLTVDPGFAAENSAAVRAEIEVSDDIEVETRLGGESSVGVNWTRDY